MGWPGSERPRGWEATFRVDGPWVLGSGRLRNGLHCDWVMFLHDDRAHGRRNSHDSQAAVDSSFGTKITASCDPGCNCLPSFLLRCSHNSRCKRVFWDSSGCRSGTENRDGNVTGRGRCSSGRGQGSSGGNGSGAGYSCC